MTACALRVSCFGDKLRDHRSPGHFNLGRNYPQNTALRVRICKKSRVHGRRRAARRWKEKGGRGVKSKRGNGRHASRPLNAFHRRVGVESARNQEEPAAERALVLFE